jgi:hypothetical protein
MQKDFIVGWPGARRGSVRDDAKMAARHAHTRGSEDIADRGHRHVDQDDEQPNLESTFAVVVVCLLELIR